MTYLLGRLTSVVVIIDFITTVVQGAASAGSDGLCFRAESLGHREGNLYYCKDPALPLCCEKDNTHTCCQAETERNVSDQVVLWGFVCLTILCFTVVHYYFIKESDQVILWGFVCLTILCFGVVYYYFSREGDYWESATVRLAADHMARRFGITIFSRRKRGNEELTPIQRDFDTMNQRASSADSKASFESTASPTRKSVDATA